MLTFTGLTGGGSALDALAVTSASVPTQRMGYDATFGLCFMRARVGPEATELPNYVRPTTYTGAAPNNVVWEKV